jgi:hypothetical protein
MSGVPLKNHVRSLGHVGLPSRRKDWGDIRSFWEGLGYTCEIKEVTSDNYDQAGAGPRLQVRRGGELVISYYCLRFFRRLQLVLFYRMMHISIKLEPAGLKCARDDVRFDHETHWGHSRTSVFITGPYWLCVELETRNPDFHNDR